MIRPIVRIAVAAMCGVIVQATTPAIGAWERFHGDAANRGFADVDTKPAAGGSLSVPGLGTFTPWEEETEGSGLVILHQEISWYRAGVQSGRRRRSGDPSRVH